MAEPRLLVLTPDYPPQVGGIQVLVHRLVSNMTRLRPAVVTLGAPGAREFDSREVVEVRRVRRARTPTLSALAVNAAGVKAAFDHRPDAVLSAHIVTSLAAAGIRMTTGVPVIQYVHAKEIATRPRLARFALRRADRSIAVSGYGRDLAVSAGARPTCVDVIPPGVDPPNRASAKGPDRFEQPTVTTISRLEDEHKGHDVLMRAFPLVRARVPDARWLVIGEGPLRPGLEASARAANGASVEFLGAVSDQRRDEILARSHVFAMLSRDPGHGMGGEGFGIVFLEAGARRVPVVAGAEGGAVDAVVHGETGLLVDPRDHVAAAEAISSLLVDRALAERLGSRGEERAGDFSWPRAAEQLEDVVLSLIERRE